MTPENVNMIMDPSFVSFINQSFSFLVGAISAAAFVLAVNTRT